MKVILTKDWAGMAKGDTYETNDKDVLLRGYESGLWKLTKEQLKSLGV